MTIHSRSHPLPFLVTTEMPCAYLPGRLERKIVTELTGPTAVETYEILSRAGFRRSHSIAYRPACSGCSACVPVRVVAQAFKPSRSLRRIARRNADLTAQVRPANSTQEQYQVFSRYLDRRHRDGEMIGMSFHEYRSMAEDSPLDTRLVEFRTPDERLVACCLADWTLDGLSAVYSFFEPDLASRGLGSYMVIWLIEQARQLELPYVYLGYWIADSRKMAYKTRFRPLEAFGATGWRPLELG
ncbi:arginyltransferase [Rhodospirillaceae bacterium SYSU D60014]|uniref:arginyltransferase n=1 Tax=Virgifigura deserti TaxID=2268457 RepID=UPI000E67133F